MGGNKLISGGILAIIVALIVILANYADGQTKPISTPPVKIQSAQGEMPSYGCAGDAKLWVLVYILDPSDPRNGHKAWKPILTSIPTLDPRGGQPACWPAGFDPNTLLPPLVALTGTAK